MIGRQKERRDLLKARDSEYSSLFTAPKPYLKVITALGKVKSGMTRDEIAKAAFKEETSTRKAVHVVFVTPYGVKPNAYSKNVQAFVQLDDLFRC